MRGDICNAIRETYEIDEIVDFLRNDREGFREKLNDDLWIDDSVTGNGSGSYTFSSYEAATNINGAEDVIEDLVCDYGIDAKEVAKHLCDWEYWDVSIRCYLLGEAIDMALDDLEEDDDICEALQEVIDREEAEEAEGEEVETA